MSNKEELAWAAGFFDGEGSSMVTWDKGAKGFPSEHKRYASLRMSLCQAGEYAQYLLDRFKNAVNGIGFINGPYNYGKKSNLTTWHWRVHGFEHTQAVIAMLWPRLGPAKRQQAKLALLTMRGYHETLSRVF